MHYVWSARGWVDGGFEYMIVKAKVLPSKTKEKKKNSPAQKS